MSDMLDTMKTEGAARTPPEVAATAAAPRLGSAVKQPSVTFHCSGPSVKPNGHDAATKRSVARSLADLLGLAFDDDLARPSAASGPRYIVPSDTLLSLDAARQLGIHAATDLFGGVVPHPFVATKVISHLLFRPESKAPAGWSWAFGEQVRTVVLSGYSVFSHDDARRAGKRLLSDGAVRVKEPGGVGGSGQTVVSDMTQLETTLAAVTPEAMALDGLVLERNLTQVTTCSVGQVRVGPWLASYCGTQGLTRNHRGHEVYGGSRLKVVRGGYEDLLRLELPTEVRTAVEQALVYDRAAMACFTGMYASRCNYDVAQGLDESGRWRSGVLEQSWRIGGASGAELAALHAFKADPALQVVRASTHEIYADDPKAPPGALVHFDGVDPDVGRLLKYARVQANGDV